MQRIFILIIFTCVLLATINPGAVAKEYLVKTQQEYKKVVTQLKAGDEVVLVNGTWSDFEIVFKGTGTNRKPIWLPVGTPG